MLRSFKNKKLSVLKAGILNTESPLSTPVDKGESEEQERKEKNPLLPLRFEEFHFPIIIQG